MWLKIRWLIISILFVLAVFVWWLIWQKTPNGILQVAFLDVGQGDAILITAPNKNQLLIDGGPDKKVLKALGRAMPFFDRSLDLVMESHPDADHIGGLPDIFERLSVNAFVEPPLAGQTDLYRALTIKAIDGKAQDIIAQTGTKIILDKDVYLDILWTNKGGTKQDTNEASIIAKLIYGQTCFLFTGDAPSQVEDYLTYNRPGELKCDVLKVSHHGSKNSNPEFFLKKVAPKYAVISVGANNRYGHPNQEVIDLLNKIKAQILMTKDSGTIIIKSDGNSLSF